jgi:membrane complex biogenesis BtpA family protein
MKKFIKIFGTKKPIVIGMVHCAPMPGYKDFPGAKIVENKFLHDFKALIAGGIDAVMIENNYDIPHYESAKKSTLPLLIKICLKARKLTKKPLGLCVLWNDYKNALLIAKKAKFNFVRNPVFVDKVKTEYGIFLPRADEAIKFRKKISAENILIFADVKVKHAKHLSKKSLAESVSEAIKKGANGIIITGKWTGDPPKNSDVNEAKKNADEIPVILGSGITPKNFRKYNADAFIVGSYFKGNDIKRERHEQNIYHWAEKIKKEKVKKFIKSIKALR